MTDKQFEKRKLLFDKIANAGILFIGYEFLFLLYILLYTTSGNITPQMGIILAIIDGVIFFLTLWIFGAVLYDIYNKL